jgi:hypothetical protein
MHLFRGVYIAVYYLCEKVVWIENWFVPLLLRPTHNAQRVYSLSLSLMRVWSRMNLEGVAGILLALIRAHRT